VEMKELCVDMDLTVVKELFIEPIREELEEAASLTPLWGRYERGLVWHRVQCRALGERLPNPRTTLHEVGSTKAIVKEGEKFSKRACWTIARDGTSDLCISGPGAQNDYHVLRHLREAEEKGEEDALLLFWLIYYHRVFRGRQDKALDGYIAMLMVRKYLSFIKYINFNHAWLREGYCRWFPVPDYIGPAIKKIMEAEEAKDELHGN